MCIVLIKMLKEHFVQENNQFIFFSWNLDAWDKFWLWRFHDLRKDKFLERAYNSFLVIFLFFIYMRVWTQIHCWWSDILSWRKKSGHEVCMNVGKGTNMRAALGQTLCWMFCMLLLENVQEEFFFFLVAGNKNSKQLILSKNNLLYYVSKSKIERQLYAGVQLMPMRIGLSHLCFSLC